MCLKHLKTRYLSSTDAHLNRGSLLVPKGEIRVALKGHSSAQMI